MNIYIWGVYAQKHFAGPQSTKSGDHWSRPSPTVLSNFSESVILSLDNNNGCLYTK